MGIAPQVRRPAWRAVLPVPRASCLQEMRYEACSMARVPPAQGPAAAESVEEQQQRLVRTDCSERTALRKLYEACCSEGRAAVVLLRLDW